MTGPPLTWVCRLPPRPGDPCVPGGCATGGWCHVESGATGVCQTEADNGQPCGQIGTGDYASCALGYCALPTPTATTGVCQATRQAGAPCTINYECDSYACDPVAKRCRAPTCPY
jgi:hypothetical protein